MFLRWLHPGSMRPCSPHFGTVGALTDVSNVVLVSPISACSSAGAKLKIPSSIIVGAVLLGMSQKNCFVSATLQSSLSTSGRSTRHGWIQMISCAALLCLFMGRIMPSIVFGTIQFRASSKHIMRSSSILSKEPLGTTKALTILTIAGDRM